MKPYVAVTRRIPEIDIRMLEERFQVKVLSENESPSPEILAEAVRDCDALLPLLSETVGEDLIQSARRLKVIANYAVGYNNIDIAAAKAKGIMVTNTPGVLTRATAEIAFSLLITLTRRIIEADRFARAGQFKGWDPLLFLGDELAGKKMGIIGMGRIGRDMAEKCRAFGMEILYYNRNRLDPDAESELNARYRTLDELLAESDAVSVHTPLTPETRHLMNAEAFGKMKPGAYFINTSRGEVMDESALADALRSGRIKGAGLDVYEFEPNISPTLPEMENVVLLPHIGSATVETRNRMAELAARNIVDALEGRVPEFLVPEMRDYFVQK